MAWNRPSTENQQPTKKNAAKAPSAKRGIIAGVVVVALGALCLYLFSNGEAPSSSLQKKDRGLIKEVAPAAAPTNRIETAKKLKKIPYWKQDNTNGFSEAMLRKWHTMRRPAPSWTNTTSLTEAPPAYAIFPSHSENVIAGYLTTRPGETMVGTPLFGRRFEEDFKKSFETPIIVMHDDPEDVAELKRLMIETKADLKARMDAGESISKILSDTHEDLRRLSSFKQDLMAEVYRVKKNPNATIEDVEDMITAANKMLNEKGVAPIKLSPISKRMLIRHKEKARK